MITVFWFFDIYLKTLELQGYKQVLKTNQSKNMNESLGKKGKSVKKTFLWILAILLLAGTGYLIYWFKTDPKAPEKFINVAGGFVIMGIILGIG